MDIYDPFNKVDQDMLKDGLIKLCSEDRYNILYISNTSALDIKKQKEIKVKDVNKYDMVITYITFKDANENLIKQLITNGSRLPVQYSYMNIKHQKLKDAHNYKNFLTKKSVDYLPELILIFSTENCLYGYPFTMLENGEIM
jgi:hypothetical protein